MVTDVYSTSFDADRRTIANEMDEGFFAKVGVSAEANEPDQELVMKLKTLLKKQSALLEQLLSEDT